MFLSKCRSGYYYIWYKDERGKKCKVSTRTKVKGEAYQVLANFKGLVKREPKSIGLRQFTEEFLAYAAVTYSPATVEIYKRTFSHLVAITGDMPIRKITARHIDEYNTRRLQRVKPVSASVELRALKAAFNTANRWKLLSENPSEESPLPSVPEQAPIFFTLDDFQRLLSVIREPWLKDVVMLAVLTGMRRSELANLRWAHVDFGRRLIHIETSASFKTKSGQRRTIPLSESAMRVVRSRVGKDSSDHVFSNRGRKVNVEWMTHLFKRYVRLAGLANDRLHFHSLRHTFASWLVQDGATLYEVQRLLGHSSPRVTEVYSHLQPEHLHGSVNRIRVPMN